MMWFHSTMWILCILPVIPYLFNIKGKYFVSRNYSLRYVVVAVLIITLASVLQPNGMEEYNYMMKCVMALNGSYRPFIDELLPLSDGRCILLYFSFLLYLALMIMNRKVCIPHLLIVYGFGGMAVMSSRMTVYYFVIVCPCLSAQLGQIDLDLAIGRLYRNINSRILFCVSSVIISVLYLLVIQVSVRIYECKIQDYCGVVDYISDNTDSIEEVKIWLSGSYLGSYAILKNLQPYIDCRAEIYDGRLNQKYDVIEEYVQMMNSICESGNAEFAVDYYQGKYDFDYYIVSRPDFGVSTESYIYRTYDALVEELEFVGERYFENEKYVAYKIVD